jgi:hypothetical protein
MYYRTIFWLTVFSIAMGYLESAVVVYLREIYYPNGFDFPLVIIDPHTGITEVLREATTMIMLLSVSFVTTTSASLRFARFIFCFGIWDLFYYIFLKLLIDWPESIFTWDILFLIPVPWVGPVITPCILSALMIVLALIIEHFHHKGLSTRINVTEWMLLIGGSLTVIVSFIWDYIFHITVTSTDSSTQQPLFHDFATYVPESFIWPVYWAGVGLIVAGMTLFLTRLNKHPLPPKPKH